MQMKLQTKLNIWYYAYFAIYVLTIALMGYLFKGRWALDSLEQPGQSIQYFVIFYMIVSVPGALYGFKQMMKKVSKIEDPMIQERSYYHWSIVRMTLIALGAIFAIVAFYVLYMKNTDGRWMHNQSMLWCAAISIIAQYFCKPTEKKIYLEMNDVREEDYNPEDHM